MIENPILIKAGAHTMAKVMYAAGVGIPTPKISATTMVNTNARKALPPAISNMNWEDFNAKPVTANDPTKTPAAAQMAATPQVLFPA